MYNNYVIWYKNPRIKYSEEKILTFNGKREIIKARNDKEAEKKAFKRLKTTGMVFSVKKI